MAHKVGDKVTVTRGPHAGQTHEIIHVHKDGSGYNVKPHNTPASHNKYRQGAAKAGHGDVKKMKESTNEAKVDDKKYAEFMAKRKKEKKQTSTQKSLADIRDRGEKAAARTEGYVSAAQRAAVWATRADGGKGHPDNKGKKSKKEDHDKTKHDAKHVKQAVGIASDPRYKGGNMTGAVKAMDKMKPGISNHPQVKAVLKRQNEDVNEISKGMASRYIKKSQVSTADAAKSIERGNMDSKSPDRDVAKAGKDQAKKGIKNFINRNKGTSTAADKLTGKAKVKATEAYSEPQGQAKSMASPLQKMRIDKEKKDRDRDGKLKPGKAKVNEKILTQKDKERAFAKAAKTAQPKSQVSLKKAPFKIPSEKDMKNEGKARDRLVKMVDKASGRTMDDRQKDAAAATKRRKEAETDLEKFQKANEKFDFKVSVDGFPEMFMSGNSPGEVKTALRKLIKQPSMIKSVDRVTKAEKKKEFRKKVREEKTSGQVDYGSDESVKILKKKTPGQKDEGMRDFMSGVVNKAKSAMSFMYKNDGKKNTNAKSTSGRQNAKSSPSLGRKINFPGYGG